MSTAKQIAANRLNGLKGGVKTQQGKLAVRHNAVSHGIFSKSVLLPGEDAELLDQLRRKLMDALNPVGESEIVLVELIVISSWRLKRVLRFLQTFTRPSPGSYQTAADYFRGIDYASGGPHKYYRYSVTLERRISKASNALAVLQFSRQVEQKSQAGIQKLETRNSQLKNSPFAITNPISEANCHVRGHRQARIFCKFKPKLQVPGVGKGDH